MAAFLESVRAGPCALILTACGGRSGFFRKNRDMEKHDIGRPDSAKQTESGTHA